MSSDIGIYGLSSQAVGLALSFAANGLNVSIGNKSSDKINECLEAAEKEEIDERVQGMKDAGEFVKSLKKPRMIILMTKYGVGAEKNFQKLLPYLEKGDILMDGSNEWYEECTRRSGEVEEAGAMYLSFGMLSTELSVRTGPGFLLSGDKAAYTEAEEILGKVAVKVDYEPAVAYLGAEVGASYTRMLLEMVENTYLQVLNEAVDTLFAAGFTNDECSKLLTNWGKTELGGVCTEAIATILKKKDKDVEGLEPQEGLLLEKVADYTIDLTAPAALREIGELAVSAPTVAASANELMMAQNQANRENASKLLRGPSFNWSHIDHAQLVDDLRNAVGCCYLVLLNQLVDMLRAANERFEWQMDVTEVLRVLKSECVLNCDLLDPVKEALDADPKLKSVVISEAVAALLKAKQASWRRVSVLSVISGRALPAILGSLAYYDDCRRDKLPTSLCQAARDYHFAETFERVDQGSGKTFHCRWTDKHE